MSSDRAMFKSAYIEVRCCAVFSLRDFKKKVYKTISKKYFLHL